MKIKGLVIKVMFEINF